MKITPDVYAPVSPNNADAATLQQSVGLDASEADTLIAARPFASNEAFLAELAKLVSETQLAAARGLLSTP